MEDVKIDADDAMDIISKVNPETLQPVESISAEATTTENPEVFKNKVSKVTLALGITTPRHFQVFTFQALRIEPALFVSSRRLLLCNKTNCKKHYSPLLGPKNLSL